VSLKCVAKLRDYVPHTKWMSIWSVNMGPEMLTFGVRAHNPKCLGNHTMVAEKKRCTIHTYSKRCSGCQHTTSRCWCSVSRCFNLYYMISGFTIIMAYGHSSATECSSAAEHRSSTAAEYTRVECGGYGRAMLSDGR
jgi:hypothetical protein